MLLFIIVVVTVWSAALVIPHSILLIQSLAAVLNRGVEKSVSREVTRPQAAVLIPAHNEALGIIRTVENVKSQICGSDRLVVIAHNCTDETEELARQAGAEVVTKSDVTLRGKGYALDAGLKYLAATKAPEVVVVLDADCLLGSPDSLSELVRCCSVQGRPVQAINIQMRLEESDPRARVSEFAWRVRTVFRTIGYYHLGLPCQLMGTGMALPWKLISQHDLATGNIAEDVSLGIAMTLVGHPPQLCPTAHVFSIFPADETGRRNQKTRWVHGYFAVLHGLLPQLLRRGFSCREINCLAMAADLTVPPLGLLAPLSLLSTALSLIGFLATGLYAPLVPSGFNLTSLAIFLGLAWFSCGRDLIGVRELGLLPAYAGGITRMLWQYLRGNRSDWLRANRQK